MNLSMSGLDYGLAPIALRERLYFTRSQAGELSGEIRRSVPGVQGCVIISTCNRTEIWLHGGPGQHADVRWEHPVQNVGIAELFLRFTAFSL